MITEKDEYKRLLTNRLEENWKSFKILFDLKHYGNCISIMCQELDQVIVLLFLLKKKEYERNKLIGLSINSQKLYLAMPDNKKEYITEKYLKDFAGTLDGWEKSIYDFGTSFHSLSKNYNYLLKNPIQGMNEIEKKQIYKYITEYHNKGFPEEFSIEDLVPVLVAVFDKLSKSLVSYMDRL